MIPPWVPHPLALCAWRGCERPRHEPVGHRLCLRRWCRVHSEVYDGVAERQGGAKVIAMGRARDVA